MWRFHLIRLLVDGIHLMAVSWLRLWMTKPLPTEGSLIEHRSFLIDFDLIILARTRVVFGNLFMSPILVIDI